MHILKISVEGTVVEYAFQEEPDLNKYLRQTEAILKKKNMKFEYSVVEQKTKISVAH